jgi:hypothetical protein
MPNFIPWLVDTTTSKIRRAASGETVAPAYIPAATTTAIGGVELSDAAPPQIGTSGAQGSSTDVAREDHTHAHGAQTDPSLHANVVAGGNAGFMTGADKTKLNGIETAAEVNAAVSLASTSPNEAALGELPVYTSKSGSTLQFLSLSGERGLIAETVGGSVRIRQSERLWAPWKASGLEAYRCKSLRSRRTAGAVGDSGGSSPWLPATLLDNHGATDHLYPYMVPTGLDFYGLPHNKHRRLRGTSLSDTSSELGYQFGHDIAAGDARARTLLAWTLSGKVENVGWTDAFIEFAVEVNPTVAVYNGSNLARMISPDIGATWSGERHFSARVFLEVSSATSWSVWGEFAIYSSTGSVLREWTRSKTITAGSHSWLTAAARVQLRWRVDRDQATRLSTFDGYNQGLRQGSDLLRLHIDAYDYEPVNLVRTN